MFVINEEDQKVPIFICLENIDQLEEDCLKQAINLSKLPFAFRNIFLASDTHMGYGCPIGGVFATESVIIPNAVGVDISCGMGFIETNIPASILHEVDTPNGKLKNVIIGELLRNIPTGFARHNDPQSSDILDKMRSYGETIEGKHDLLKHTVLVPELQAGYYQIGSLGGGNHFLEIQEDENSMVGIMVHSGSRNFGYKICKYFNEKAKLLNKTWYTSIPESYDLAFLPTSSQEGMDYIGWMHIAMEFAKENRYHMMKVCKNVVERLVSKFSSHKVEVLNEINVHHNYAALENHGGKNVWVHRKGAIRVREGEIGIIPGAMGSYSYIVKGLGYDKSFNSCSHGAGRKMSRKKAKDAFSVQSVIEELKNDGVVIGKSNKDDIGEECKHAYKDIDFVIEQQKHIIEPIKKLKTIGVIKG